MLKLPALFCYPNKLISWCQSYLRCSVIRINLLVYAKVTCAVLLALSVVCRLNGLVRTVEFYVDVDQTLRNAPLASKLNFWHHIWICSCTHCVQELWEGTVLTTGLRRFTNTMPFPCRDPATTLSRTCRCHERLLLERHGRGIAEERHGMCESNTTALCKSNGKDTI
jgi:hypothetical protein